MVGNGVWGVCVVLTADVDEIEGGVTRQHPAPWTVTDPPHTFYRDATGGLVFATVSHDPRLRELLRVAPEMESLLRTLEFADMNPLSATARCPSCLGTPYLGHAAGCALAALLAKIDAAAAS